LAGIYIHIPFCKQACHYCDFHFSTSLKLKDQLISALLNEIRLQKSFGDNRIIETIYFGGGTPSLFSADELISIFNVIAQTVALSENPECTLECNPDDLSPEYLQNLFDSPVNRLSIGIQSFFDEDLKLMNRAHLSQHAHDCIQDALKIGFDNITCDLIFGSHSTTDQMWESNLQTLVDYQIPHISVYGLTVEPKTALSHFIQSGKYPSLDDSKYQAQFLKTQDLLCANGYEQYEISNYASNQKISKHNSAYWQGEDYLGIGPSSHSFYDGCRYWNVKSNVKYIEEIKKNLIPCEKEELTEYERYNEYLLTGLRTMAGCSFQKLKSFAVEIQNHFEAIAEELIDKKMLIRNEKAFYIPQEQRIFTDGITQELFYVV